jgi:hypothetical protein
MAREADQKAGRIPGEDFLGPGCGIKPSTAPERGVIPTDAVALSNGPIHHEPDHAEIPRCRE